jgi:hypothetical protein
MLKPLNINDLQNPTELISRSPKNTKNFSSVKFAGADPRLAFLHRAHARLILFENGLMSLDEAFVGLDLQCACDREAIGRMERHCRRKNFKETQFNG